MVCVTGSIAFDYIMDFPGKFADNIDPSKTHILNVSFLVNDLKKQRGGTAPNIAYTLSLLAVKSNILGVAGNDFSEYGTFLQKIGVDTSSIKLVDVPTATAFMITDVSDNQISAFYPGAMNHSDISLSSIDTPDFVSISPNLPDLMIKLTQESKTLNIPYLFDPGRQLPRFSDDQLLLGIAGSRLLLGNDYEIGQIQKRLDRNLLELTPVVITTLAEKGSRISTKDGDISVPAAKITQMVDPTGAGDAFQAGLIAGLMNNFNLQASVQMGAVAACYCVEKYGTTSHQFSLDEFRQRYKENFGELHYG